MSVYYSHVLQMLFFSYCQGKSFAATISRTTLEVLQLFSINIKRWEGPVLISFMTATFSRVAPPPSQVLVSVTDLVKCTLVQQTSPFPAWYL